MSLKLTMAGVMTALMVLSIPMVYADVGMMDKGDIHQEGGQHGDHDKMMDEILGLSDDQVKQLNDLHQKERDSMKATFEQLKTNKEALEAEIVKANPDMNKVNDLENQLKTTQGQMIDSHLNSILAIKKILSPEQFAGYMALKKEKQLMMMHQMHDRFKHHGDFDKDGHHSWGDKDQEND